VERKVVRKYTRLEQRRYREKRRAQAARVAERLMGRKKIPHEYGGDIDSLNYKFSTNLYVARPRMSSIITDFNGV
jgi:hypothetical protein